MIAQCEIAPPQQTLAHDARKVAAVEFGVGAEKLGMQNIEAFAAAADYAHERQQAQPVRVIAQSFVRQTFAPRTADVVPPLAAQPPFPHTAQGIFMIAEHRVEPRFVEQRERGFRLHPAIDQIADRKKPITRRIEHDLAQQIAQRIDTAVQIANDKVPADPVRPASA